MKIRAVDYEEFEELKNMALEVQAQMVELRAERDFLRSLVSDLRWLSKTQVLSVLKISELKLWRLAKENVIISSEEGKKTVYDIDSVKSYFYKSRKP